MSATLCWRPVAPPSDDNDLPDGLRFVLEKRHPDWSGEITYGVGELEYLEGLRDGGVKGAQSLIDLIERHGVVALWRQY